jgi:hypothetical protein
VERQAAHLHLGVLQNPLEVAVDLEVILILLLGAALEVALVALGVMVVLHVGLAAYHLQVSSAVVDFPIQAAVVEPLEALMVQELLLNLVAVLAVFL